MGSKDVTEAVMAEMLECQGQSLKRLFPAVFFDCPRVKIRDDRAKQVNLPRPRMLADGAPDASLPITPQTLTPPTDIRKPGSP